MIPAAQFSVNNLHDGFLLERNWGMCGKFSRNYVLHCFCFEHPKMISIAEQFDLFNCRKILRAQRKPRGWWLLLRLVGGTLWLGHQWQERLSVRETPPGAKLPPSERVCGRSQNRLKRQPVCFGLETSTHTHRPNTNPSTLEPAGSPSPNPLPSTQLKIQYSFSGLSLNWSLWCNVLSVCLSSVTNRTWAYLKKKKKLKKTEYLPSK